jgi:hypothetical protein
MLAEVTVSAADIASWLPLLIKVAAVLIPLFLPQVKQPIIAILQSLLDALNDMPTVIKSANVPNDAQTLRASKTLRKRATCASHAKAIDDVAATALFSDASKVNAGETK